MLSCSVAGKWLSSLRLDYYYHIVWMLLTIGISLATAAKENGTSYKNITIVLNTLLDTYEQAIRPGTEGMHGQYCYYNNIIHNSSKYVLQFGYQKNIVWYISNVVCSHLIYETLRRYQLINNYLT